MNDVSDWWRTSIIDMEPGRIDIRGRSIENLIGTISFAQMVWLMTKGDMPNDGQAQLLEAALVAAVDHGPQAPSIAAARMSVTCGLSLNGAMGTAIHMLDDVHGGAGEQLIMLLGELRANIRNNTHTIASFLDSYRTEVNPFIPGFGHRFHTPVDPRAPRLMQLVREAQEASVIDGEYMQLGISIEHYLQDTKGKPVPMNIDGATAIIFAELGFAPPLARGLFCLSRSVGAMAHGWEQMQQGERNKGPTPPQYRWTYDDHNS